MNTPSNPPAKPLAEPRSVEITQLGRRRVDDYGWLRDANWREVMADPKKLRADIRAHLEAENAYTQALLAPLEGLREDIFAEMKARLEPEDAQVPVPDGPYAYAHRYRKDDQHGVHERMPREDWTARETVLDLEALAKGSAFFDLGDVVHSRDHAHIAWSVDRKGSETYRIWTKPATADLSEAQDTGIDCAGAIVWSADNATLYWVERDDNQRPYAVFRADVFAGAEPELVYKESDPGFFVSVSDSDSGAFVEISAHNHTTSEIWRVVADDPAAPALCFAPREPGVEYSLHESQGSTYILTNWDRDGGKAVDFQIMRCPGCPMEAGDQRRDRWEPFIPHRPGTLVLGLVAYRDYLVALERENALPRIVIIDSTTAETVPIAMDEDAYALGLLEGYEYDTDTIRFSYSSPTTPSQVIAYDVSAQTRTVLKTQTVPSGHDPADYETRRISVTARDGVEVPVTLLMRAGTVPDGSHPLMLYGYGSYGITIPAAFRTTTLSLVDRGFVYAIAHIRGSMAKGYQWYLDGKLEAKTNTFDDFVDCARGLVDLGWTARGRIVIRGGSAGGLLVGAALNRAADVFGGAVAAVPFVDALNTMSDADLPLTPPEWPEWGNPLEDADAYDRIAAWSPYDNIVARAHPPVLATAGLTDPRVTYWEPAKWIAKLRANQTGSAPVMLKTNMDAGHQGESGRYDSLKELALEYAFAVGCVSGEFGDKT